jgi:hypothetical protein
MKKITILGMCLLGLISVAGCCRCEKEPIVEENGKLIIPPDFGKMAK